MQTGPDAQINVCMWFRAKDLEPQNQSMMLRGLHTEAALFFNTVYSGFLYKMHFK